MEYLRKLFSASSSGWELNWTNYERY